LTEIQLAKILSSNQDKYAKLSKLISLEKELSMAQKIIRIQTVIVVLLSIFLLVK